jgi:hypothetical protein
MVAIAATIQTARWIGFTESGKWNALLDRYGRASRAASCIVV